MVKLKKLATTLGLSTAIACSAMLPLKAAIAAEIKPNFVTIVIDDMGYSDLSMFGGEVNTPHLKQMAEEGTIMTNFYAASSSSPSRSMLFSGKDNHKAGVGDMRENMKRNPREETLGQPGYEGVLSLDILPFPQVLQDNDYHTMMTGKWHMGGDEENEEEYYPINRGFTETKNLLLSGGDIDFRTDANGEIISETEEKVFGDRFTLYNDNGKETDFSTLAPESHSTNIFTDSGIAMLDNWDGTKPFYLNMSYLAPHMPVQAPKELIDKYIDTYSVGWDKIREQRFAKLKELGYVADHVVLSERPGDVPAWDTLSEREKQFETRRMAIYAAEIELLDQNVGRLIEYLKGRGVYEDTVFISYSDNGVGFVSYGKAPEGTEDHNHIDVDGLSEEEFSKLMDDLGGANSFINYNTGWAHVSNTPHTFYKGDTFDGGIKDPAFIHYPKAKVKGVTTNCLHSVMDVAPTILDMAGLEYPTEYKGKPNEPMDGVSMADLFDGKLVCNPDRWLGFELFGIKGLRKGNWKLAQGNAMGNVFGLYNVWDDPFEQNNLAEERPDVYKAMLAVYDQYAKENGVIEVSNLILPDLIDTANTTARVRGGSANVFPNGRTAKFANTHAPKVASKVSAAGEVRPKKEDIGQAGSVYAYAKYTPAGEQPIYFWLTEQGLVPTQTADEMMPWKTYAELPQMIFVPFYEGKLNVPADIEIVFGYQADGASAIDNADNPVVITPTAAE